MVYSVMYQRWISLIYLYQGLNCWIINALMFFWKPIHYTVNACGVD